MQTIANMYNLSRFVDSFHSYISELPANVLPYLRVEEDTLLCRYIYYDQNNYENFLYAREVLLKKYKKISEIHLQTIVCMI